MAKELKVVVLRPNGSAAKGKMPMPSLAVAELTSMAKSVGGILQFDINAYGWDEFVNGPFDPLLEEPDIILMTSLSTDENRARCLFAEIKDARRMLGKPIKLVRGGIQATGLPKTTLDYADVVFRGGITTDGMARLLQKAVSLESEKRIICRQADIPSKINYPIPDYGYLGPNLEGLDQFFLNISAQTSVGCPNGCPFCSVTSVNGAEMRVATEGSIRAQLLVATRSKKIVAVIDDNALQNADKRSISHLKKVALLMKEYGLRWAIELTAYTLIDAQEMLRQESEDFIHFLAECGCWGMYFGIETVEEDGAGLKKSRPIKDIERLIGKLHREDIAVLCAFVVGVSPNESNDTVKNILDFCERNYVDFAQFSVNTPVPATAAFLLALIKGEITDINFHHYDATREVKKFPTYPPGLLEERHRKLYEGFYSKRSMVKRIGGRLFEIRSHSFLELRDTAIVAVVNGALQYNRKQWTDKVAQRAVNDPPVKPDYESDGVRLMMEEDVFKIHRANDGVSELI